MHSGNAVNYIKGKLDFQYTNMKLANGKDIIVVTPDKTDLPVMLETTYGVGFRFNLPSPAVQDFSYMSALANQQLNEQCISD